MNTAILTILTIIMFCALIGVLVLFEMRSSLKRIPNVIIELILAPLEKAIQKLKSEVKSIKDEISDSSSD